MTVDRELLEEFLERIADKFTAAELIELLEDAGILTVWDVIAVFEDELIEAREKLEV